MDVFLSRKACATGPVCLWRDSAALSLPRGGISVMSSSPAPHSCNLVAPTTASLGGDRPEPFIPGQSSILWELPGEGIHSQTQRLCITCQGVLLTEQDAQACMEQPGGVAESDPSVAPKICKTRAVGTLSTPASMLWTHGPCQLLFSSPMATRIGQKWPGHWPTRTEKWEAKLSCIFSFHN